jgi:hypothetical protein
MRLLKKLKNTRIDIEAREKDGSKAKNVFLDNWSKAVMVLRATKTMVKNPLAKLIIGIVIGIGNGIYEQIND